ncbi:putative TonB-dependent outer membrane receptor [Tenacibaculum maritimum]|nr:putative TonB-dependent outer membrane receptor [Tenacibaculum maritimum]
MGRIALGNKPCKTIFLGILFCFMNMYSQEEMPINSLDAIVLKIKRKKMPIKQVFKLIEQQKIGLAYSSNKIDVTKELFLKKKKYSIRELLTLSIQGTSLKILQLKNKVLLINKNKRSRYIVVSGYIKEAFTKEPLIGASIYTADLTTGAIANNYGFYSLKLERDKDTLIASYLGFKAKKLHLTIDKDTIFHNFYLLLNQDNLEEVVIDGKLSLYKKHTKSHERILKEGVDNGVNLFGESDFIKTLQTKVGVISNFGGVGNLNVRAGNANHNLVLMDGIPVYNYNHMGGVFSIFNSQAIKKVDFYKGVFPANYNGRLSSVIDVRTKDGDKDKYHGGIVWTPIAISSFLEGPIAKGKSSFLTSFRKSILGFFIGAVDMSIYDFNFKVNYDIDQFNKLYFSLYAGRDRFKESSELPLLDGLDLNWGNFLTSVKWNHIYTPNVFQHTSFTYSEFDNKMGTNSMVNEKGEKVNAINKIKDISLKTDFEYYTPSIQTNFGLSFKYVAFKSPLESLSLLNRKKIFENRSIHAISYVQSEVKLTDKLRLSLGFNSSTYIVKGKSLWNFLPRATITYTPSPKNEWFGSFSMLSQFDHEITIGPISLPSEFRAPSTKELLPEESTIIELGYQRRFDKNSFLNIQAYYKQLHGIIRYRAGQSSLGEWLAPKLKDRVLIGARSSKGVELQFVKKMKKGSVEISYALSDSEDYFDAINKGISFPSELDIRNMINISFNVMFNQYLSFNISGNYSSGRRISIPKQTFIKIDDVLDVDAVNDQSMYSYQIDKPNEYRLADNYHLNLGGKYRTNLKKYNYWEFGLGVHNLIANPVPFFVSTSIDSNTKKIIIEKSNPINFLPYISVRYKF